MMQEQEVLAAPYKGDKPYIFISYSHKDRDEAVKSSVCCSEIDIVYGTMKELIRERNGMTI